ncbi:MAG: PHP domain-containing protein [Bacilli bacterium]|nr:PHP domain-containing protein [Bacilli bacterium]
MIDLHMHTTYSDGTDLVLEILKKVDSLGLEVISITDHNTCRIYYELESISIKDIYKGEIIVGTEFTTSFEGRIIEVLGYGFDYKKVNDYLDKFYSKELVSERTQILEERLLKIINDLGLTFNENNLRERKHENEFFERGIYEELVSHSENKNILKEDVWISFSNFFRKGVTNPNSKLYINHQEFKPSLREIIELIHNSGGIAFLAHPYRYKFTDTEEFINRLYNQYKLDGVECFYTSFSEEQTAYLVDFAKARGLLMSGGSDYHGDNRKDTRLGCGRGNLVISKDVLANWPVKSLEGRTI